MRPEWPHRTQDNPHEKQHSNRDRHEHRPQRIDGTIGVALSKKPATPKSTKHLLCEKGFSLGHANVGCGHSIVAEPFIQALHVIGLKATTPKRLQPTGVCGQFQPLVQNRPSPRSILVRTNCTFTTHCTSCASHSSSRSHFSALWAV